MADFAEGRGGAKATLTRTDAEIEAEDRRRGAAERWYTQEMKKQENLETIVKKTVPLLAGAKETQEDVDQDWVNRCILEAQEVSDDGLQQLWALLLAGQFKAPGKYSRRLFRLLKELEPKHVAMIKTCAARLLSVEESDSSITPFLHSHIFQEWRREPWIQKEPIATEPIEQVRLLQELGVVETDDFIFEFRVDGTGDTGGIHLSGSSAKRIFAGPRHITAAYYQPLFVSEPDSPGLFPGISQSVMTIIFDAWRVTLLGEELFELVGVERDTEHLEHIRTIRASDGLKGQIGAGLIFDWNPVRFSLFHATDG
jgi:hypothetical protein